MWVRMGGGGCVTTRQKRQVSGHAQSVKNSNPSRLPILNVGHAQVRGLNILHTVPVSMSDRQIEDTVVHGVARAQTQPATRYRTAVIY